VMKRRDSNSGKATRREEREVKKKKMENGKSIVAIAIAAIMVISVMTAIIPSTTAQHEEEAVNTLRVYGEGSLGTPVFPYTDPEAPFDPTNAEVPQKDFVTFNPAFMYHFKNDFFMHAIFAEGDDASEKVFLRQWYVPEYEEPRGTVWTDQPPVSRPDIVNEYTYMLVRSDGSAPVEGSAGATSFVLPIADNLDQIGLDSYDVDNDGESDRVLIKNTNPRTPEILDWIDIGTDAKKLEEGDEIQFMDFKAKIVTITEATTTVEIYYQGNKEPGNAIAIVTVPNPPGDRIISANRHDAHYPANLAPIYEPWYLVLTSVDSVTKTVHVAVGRYVSYGETFFVDGAEYDVAMIHGHGGKFKYITIRNPLPKEEVLLERLSVIKEKISEDLPMLPPFNEVHDIIDDIDVAHDDGCLEGAGYSIVGDELIPDDDCIAEDYDTVMERRAEDQPPLEIKYTAETTEPRFHTNLLEIYDDLSADALTPLDEDWKWLHTWTKPDAYTEFIYPVEVLMTSSFTSGNDRIKFVYDGATGTIYDIYVNLENKGLRIYGNNSDDTPVFPYTDPEAPFDPTNAESPRKDFVTFNPAFMYHFKNDFFMHAIFAEGDDASEKVFLRQWYVPEYEEPRGTVWTDQPPVSRPDIVNEYTYMLVRSDGSAPVEGSAGATSFVLPIADNLDQIGLDSYDVDNDGESDRVLIKNTNPRTPEILDWIDIGTDAKKLEEGDEIQFMDFKAKIVTITEATTTVEIYYQGNKEPGNAIAIVTVPNPPGDRIISANRHDAHYPANLAPIYEPWYLVLTSVDSVTKTVHVAVGRYVSYGETFFVDGAEYDVAMIHGHGGKFKYITIRNPLPKEEVLLERLSVIKEKISEDLPMLPPFNEVHDIIDDIDVAHDDGCLEGAGYSIVGDELIPDDDCIAEDYDTVMERRAEDQPPLEIKYTAETTEPRFHTNLLEIYDDLSADALTPLDEDWKWLHTWTKPDAYTEFIYPVEVLMTSSFTAPNSGGNRLKFVYDAAVNSNGIYVNTTIPIEGFDPCMYDTAAKGGNENGEIDRFEVINAIQDYYNDVITRTQAIDVIQKYYEGPGACL